MAGNLNPGFGRGSRSGAKTLYVSAVTGLATIGGACGLPVAVRWYCMMNRTSSNGFRNERSHSRVYRGLESQLGAGGSSQNQPQPFQNHSESASLPCVSLRRLGGVSSAAECSRGREIAGRVPSNDFQRFPTVSDGVLQVYSAGECVADRRKVHDSHVTARVSRTRSGTASPPLSQLATPVGAWLTAACSRGRESALWMPSNDFQRFATVSDGIL